jgi:hypothetical protein
MEIADFVHLDMTASPPRLSLIHVKGAKSDSATRGVAVSPFEVVTGQAVKNIRHLDNLILSDGLQNGLGKKISSLVWNNGAPAQRQDMIEALDDLGADYERQVVVVQPQALKSSIESARQDPTSAGAARLRQLDALLTGAAAACRNVSAGFIVVGDVGAPPPRTPAPLNP